MNYLNFEPLDGSLVEGGTGDAKFEFELCNLAATAAAAASASEGLGGVDTSCSFGLPWSSHFLLRL